MRLREIRKPFLFLSLLVLALLLALAMACGDDDEEETATGSGSPTGVGTIDVSDVPELKDGKLTVGSDIAYPPVEFYVEGTNTPDGFDIDIAKAMAKAMGVEVEFEQVADFAGIVGDLKSKRYDIVMSAISITPEREGQIDFVPYFGPVGTGILVAKGNPKGFKTLEDLCGFSVAAQVGTYQVDQMDALNAAACKGNEIKVQTFPDNPAAVQELILGRVDAELADDPVAAFSALESKDKLEVAATGFEAATYGIGVRKDSPKLKTALEEAFKAIRDNGDYDKILEHWGQTEFALKD